MIVSRGGRAGPAAALVAALYLADARAADPKPGPPLTIHRAAGPITLDGDLSDAGWQGVEPITTWFEVNPSDNTEPKVRNIARLAYDDKYFYAALEFEDPDPSRIRAPLGDHDAVSGSTDYGGVIIDSRNDGKTAQMFLANPRGTQYDALTSDATGEDPSPDFYWDAAGKITATGWTLEIRIPFSSLRYDRAGDPTWGILIYRNYPRDRRYQFFTARLPRDVNCFVCNSSKLTGLAGLPRGSHLVVAPFATASRSAASPDGPGTPLAWGATKGDAGLDVKWNPNANNAVDATINPDFSQVESDAAQISTNERFALFYPEKRPFFLEGIDLFATPIQAVYTRTVTAPRGGLRLTGRSGSTSYTMLLTEDEGGGLVVLPGPTQSGLAPQDFGSRVGIGRVKRDFGQSFASFLVTARQIDGGGYNRVFGPDFQWRPKPSDAVTGQFLWSDTRTPNRPDLAQEWDGRRLSDHALNVNWAHNTEHVDWYAQALDIGGEFRADEGFVPQVGYREGFLDTGYTWRPKDRFLSRFRLWTQDFYDRGENGATVASRVSAGVGMDGGSNSTLRVELNDDRILVGTTLLHRARPVVTFQVIPGRVLNGITLQGFIGQEIDFENAREGRGGDLAVSATLRPSDHVELRASWNGRWLDVDAAPGLSGRLFTAQVDRLRLVWSFTSRMFVRLIGQYVETTRDPALYVSPVPPRDASLSGSALFAYKVNWQTLIYVGYGDDRAFTDVTGRIEPADRQLFLKLSYAWQR